MGLVKSTSSPLAELPTEQQQLDLLEAFRVCGDPVEAIQTVLEVWVDDTTARRLIGTVVASHQDLLGFDELKALAGLNDIELLFQHVSLLQDPETHASTRLKAIQLGYELTGRLGKDDKQTVAADTYLRMLEQISGSDKAPATLDIPVYDETEGKVIDAVTEPEAAVEPGRGASPDGGGAARSDLSYLGDDAGVQDPLKDES